MDRVDPFYSMIKSLGIKELGATEIISVGSEKAWSENDLSAEVTINEAPEIVQSGANLKEFFEANGLTTIDKRSNGGCLWVIGDEKTIGHIVNEAKARFGAVGSYGEGKQTKGNPGWWTKTNK